MKHALCMPLKVKCHILYNQIIVNRLNELWKGKWWKIQYSLSFEFLTLNFYQFPKKNVFDLLNFYWQNYSIFHHSCSIGLNINLPFKDENFKELSMLRTINGEGMKNLYTWKCHTFLWILVWIVMKSD